MKRFGLLMVVLALLSIPLFGAAAQDMPVPQVNLAADQLILGGFVEVDSIYSEGPGFVVIHRSSDGGVAGVSQALTAGWTFNLRIGVDTSVAEAQMSAMLHADDNTVGTYEFGTVEGADGPVSVDGNIVNPIFNAQVLSAGDQILEGSTLTIASVTMPEGGWVVVHSGDAASFGGVLGQTLVPAGTSTDVAVELSGDITPVLWPMLHVDNGEIGAYEFDGGEIDGPVVVGGAVASIPVWTVNHLRVADQIVLHGDNAPMQQGQEMMAPVVMVRSVLSAGPGIVVIHANDNGNAGAILGAAFVEAGVTTNIEIPLDGDITPVVWPMLHDDAGTIGAYDGIEVDPPSVDNTGAVVTFTTNIAPSLTVADQALTDGMLVIRNAVIDAPGWIAIHSDNDGQPGPVIATAQLHVGANWDVMIPVDAAAAGAQVWPMLHYDDNTMGTYEFGTVDGADAPTFVQEQVIVVPLAISG
jgi:hypothetical protein